MKLTTDRHEASRGLFATAELLVYVHDYIGFYFTFYFIFIYSAIIAASKLIHPRFSSVRLSRVDGRHGTDGRTDRWKACNT